jgi:hypothetical protein
MHNQLLYLCVIFVSMLQFYVVTTKETSKPRRCLHTTSNTHLSLAAPFPVLTAVPLNVTFNVTNSRRRTEHNRNKTSYKATPFSQYLC